MGPVGRPRLADELSGRSYLAERLFLRTWQYHRELQRMRTDNAALQIVIASHLAHRAQGSWPESLSALKTIDPQLRNEMDGQGTFVYTGDTLRANVDADMQPMLRPYDLKNYRFASSALHYMP